MVLGRNLLLTKAFDLSIDCLIFFSVISNIVNVYLTLRAILSENFSKR